MNDLRDRAIAAYQEKSKTQHEQHLKNLESKCRSFEREFINCFDSNPNEVDCNKMIIKCAGLRFKKNGVGNWCVVDNCVTCGKRVLVEIVDLVGLGEYFEGVGKFSVCVDCQKRRIEIHKELQVKPFWKRVLGWE